MGYELSKDHIFHSLRELELGTPVKEGSEDLWSRTTAHEQVRTPSLQSEAKASVTVAQRDISRVGA